MFDIGAIQSVLGQKMFINDNQAEANIADVHFLWQRHLPSCLFKPITKLGKYLDKTLNRTRQLLKHLQWHQDRLVCRSVCRAGVCDSWQGPRAGFSFTHSLQPPTVTLQPYLESAQLTHIIPSDVHQHSSSTFRSQRAADTMFSPDFLLCISKLATNEAIC